MGNTSANKYIHIEIKIRFNLIHKYRI